jgi:hypothetical protein
MRKLLSEVAPCRPTAMLPARCCSAPKTNFQPCSIATHFAGKGELFCHHVVSARVQIVEHVSADQPPAATPAARETSMQTAGLRQVGQRVPAISELCSIAPGSTACGLAVQGAHHASSMPVSSSQLASSARHRRLPPHRLFRPCHRLSPSAAPAAREASAPHKPQNQRHATFATTCCSMRADASASPTR